MVLGWDLRRILSSCLEIYVTTIENRTYREELTRKTWALEYHFIENRKLLLKKPKL